MITLRMAASRGHFDHGWLDTYHTFSFGEYVHPDHTGFRTLRVINEDRVQPGAGFPTHHHENMEILTFVLDGALEHKDSMGNGSVIRADDVQRMSAGTGVTHSEFNASDEEPVHFLQIWVLPDRRGINPGYEQKTFSAARRDGLMQLIASADGRDGSLVVHQDIRLWAAALRPGQAVSHEPAPGRHTWVQVTRGSVDLEDLTLNRNDGAAISDEASLTLRGRSDAEILLFDLG